MNQVYLYNIMQVFDFKFLSFKLKKFTMLNKDII
jgi:hypothetical protein